MEQDKTISAPQSRIHVLDALRGFALLGVILIHMLQHFGVSSGLQADLAHFPRIDTAVGWLAQHVIMGKFINIFAFLFGMSFFIQMDRAARKGIDFRKRFIWRMLLLFAIGLVGNSFFTADILPIYAAFGIVMVFLFPLSNKALLMIAFLLIIGTPRLLTNHYRQWNEAGQAAPVQTESTIRPSETSRPSLPPTASFIGSVRHNLTTGFVGKLNYQFGLNGRGYVTLSLFILGLVVGRWRFFEKLEQEKRQNRLLLGGFILLTGLLNLLPLQAVGYRQILSGEALTSVQLLSMAIKDIQTVSFSAALALGFILLFQAPAIRKRLDLLSPYGRMGLTNYVTQSILGGILFSLWGFGDALGRWGATELFLLGIVIYCGQVLFSRIWLSRYLYGPLEWAWRSGTYRKLQGFRR